jgi:hypothetical protein
MRTFNIFISLILILVTSCELNKIQDDPNYSGNLDELVTNNINKISINSGIAGTLLKKEGNCMPMIGGTSTCKTYPVSRTIKIFEYSTDNDVEGWGPLYSSVNSKLIAKYSADQNGFFQMSVKPGKYSIFICEDNKYYANGLDGQGGINPVIVKADSISKIILTLDYAVY